MKPCEGGRGQEPVLLAPSMAAVTMTPAGETVKVYSVLSTSTSAPSAGASAPAVAARWQTAFLMYSAHYTTTIMLFSAEGGLPTQPIHCSPINCSVQCSGRCWAGVSIAVEHAGVCVLYLVVV
jgi:hypothetical protein